MKRIKLLLLLALSFISIVYIFIFAHEYDFLINSENISGEQFSGSALFYNYYMGVDTIIPTLVILLLIPFISHFDSSTYKISHFDYQIIIRMGRKKYMKKHLIKSFMDIWYFPVVINLIMISIIHFFFIPVFGVKESYPVYMNGIILNFIFFTAFQIIGWSMLNCVSFFLSQIVTNKYIYPFSLVGLSLGITILLGVIGNFLPYSKWLNIIRNALSPLYLVSPGVIGLWSIQISEQFLTVFFSFLIYLFILFVMYKICKVKFHD